ncbi:hypothetical protein G3576_16610 [Roseomonas stagni]|uniref:Uncharacterized protein n=1 Tax=Falsiroseomonas algicola TaxID=2716930 RepID=A0A6M1LN53_9PROT|nr:hypothetical protein [Falsiroseomonas algicola]NGM21647.1 hypothetical protein [Falsiroseomonas algicola]
MRSASAEHLPEAAGLAGTMMTGPSPVRAVILILLVWAVATTIFVGGVGAWVAMWRRWRV